MTEDTTPLVTRWTVGLDPRKGSEGSLHFSAWLRDALGADAASVLGVHVYGDVPSVALRYLRLEELEERARTEVTSLLVRTGAEAWLDGRELSSDRGGIANVLAAATERLGAGFLVVGRSAPREGRSLLRLGSTARRLLRRLPVPVVVVAPDFVPPPADAPILIATNLGPESEAALRFGHDLAVRTGRETRVVYCLEQHHAAQYIPETTLARLTVERTAKARTRLAEWIDSRGVSVDEQSVLLGDAVESLSAHVRSKGAALLVCGSRRLSLTERVFLTSAGSELAALAPCPVAVVPPTTDP